MHTISCISKFVVEANSTKLHFVQLRLTKFVINLKNISATTTTTTAAKLLLQLCNCAT